MLAFSALADPTRLRIVEMLGSSGRLSASDIGRHFTMSAPAISQHLKVLREARLVKVEAKAQQRIYALNPDGIGEIEQWLHHMREVWSQRFDALDAFLQEEMKKADKTKATKREKDTE